MLALGVLVTCLTRAPVAAAHDGSTVAGLTRWHRLALEPSLTNGLLLFGAGGAVVLPLLFVVAGAFLPPRTPRFARGVTFSTIIWTGFVLAFWPGGDSVTVGLFLLFSLLSHWVYGLVLGGTIEYLVGIPEHDV